MCDEEKYKRIVADARKLVNRDAMRIPHTTETMLQTLNDLCDILFERDTYE